MQYCEKLFNTSSFWNTMGHSELHVHAACDDVLLAPLPALAIERIQMEKWANQENPFKLTSLCKLKK